MNSRTANETSLVLSPISLRSFFSRITQIFQRFFNRAALTTTETIKLSQTASKLNVDRVALKQAVEQLPSGYRAIFLLHDVYGYDHQQIAGKLGIEFAVSKSQLHIARLKLRALLLKNSIVANTTASCREMLTA